MKTVILAGGFGTRFSEETYIRPKPLIEIGELPIVCHLMEIYSQQGYTEFILCLGYKSAEVKNWFLNYYEAINDFTLDFSEGSKVTLTNNLKNWKISFIDTGDSTNTAGRIRRVSHLINEDKFFLTYADGLGSINLKELLSQHNSNKETLVTLTATSNNSRFGEFEILDESVKGFREKPLSSEKFVNSGFFVVERKIFEEFNLGDSESWEKGVLEPLSSQGKLGAYKHTGFWKSMDTLRDKREFEALVLKNQYPWLEVRDGKDNNVRG
jgi:glucose-1-phosphate cytidylyltransferase